MIYIILPIFNEEDVIGKLLENIKATFTAANLGYKVIAVNDGSKDKTLDVLNSYSDKLPIEIIDFGKNRGVGEVFRTGFKRAAQISSGGDIIVTMDADNTHNPATILEMKAKLDGGFDVVVGSCFTKGGKLIGVPPHRVFFTIICNGLYQVLFPIKGVAEYTGFYRAYNADMIKEILKDENFIGSKGFAVMAEFLLRLRLAKAEITEVPMVVRYDLKGLKSKLKIIPTIQEHFKVILKYLFKK